MYKKLLLTGILFSFFSSLSFAQDEQVTVIGSLIKGTPIDSGSPISTFNAEEIAAQGNLNIVELIKMVPGSSGVDGEANQFGSNGSEGISNINLRGLGTNRTLVLINGKRQVTVPSRTGAGRSPRACARQARRAPGPPSGSPHRRTPGGQRYRRRACLPLPPSSAARRAP